MAEEGLKNISKLDLSYIHEADDYNTQIMTNVGTYITMLTADQPPSTKQITKLMKTIKNPLQELSQLIQTRKFSEQFIDYVNELQRCHEEIEKGMDDKLEEVSEDMASKIVSLYHTTSDLDNVIFDLLSTDPG